MADELIDVFDENNNLIGVFPRSQIYQKDYYHRVVRILVYNSQGEVLTQLRSEEKELYPNHWDIGIAGHVVSGESHLAAALRELEEETGLAVSESDLDFIAESKFTSASGDCHDNGFTYTYLLRFDGESDKIKIQAEETQLSHFVPIAKLEEEFKSGSKKFIPHSINYWEKIARHIKKRLE